MQPELSQFAKRKAAHIFVDNEDINLLNKILQETTCMHDKCNELECLLGLKRNIMYKTACKTDKNHRIEALLADLFEKNNLGTHCDWFGKFFWKNSTRHTSDYELMTSDQPTHIPMRLVACYMGNPSLIDLIRTAKAEWIMLTNLLIVCKYHLPMMWKINALGNYNRIYKDDYGTMHGIRHAPGWTHDHFYRFDGHADNGDFFFCAWNEHLRKFSGVVQMNLAIAIKLENTDDEDYIYGFGCPWSLCLQYRLIGMYGQIYDSGRTVEGPRNYEVFDRFNRKDYLDSI